MSRIVKRKVTAKRVRWMCDKPCPGEMLPTGVCLTMYPALYPHRCNVCGRVENSHETFPYIEYSDE